MISTKLVLIALVLCTALCSSCSRVKPWVKPYERANLADEVMQFDRDPVSSSYLEHVYEARESARGAGISTGGGCGCN